MKKILTLILLLTLGSCVNSLSLIDFIHLAGVKKSKDETPEEISKFLKRKKYKYDKSVLLIDSLLPLRKSEAYIFAHQDNDRVAALQVRVFDSTGAYYTSFSQCHGDFNKKKVVAGIPIVKNSQKDYINHSLSLHKELVLFDLSLAEKYSIATIAQNYIYTIVVYYTIWTNHFSEKVLKQVSQLKKEHPNKVYVILANSAMDKVSVLP